MDHLYQSHFGLTQAPFNITPDPSFLYLSESHREALAQLSYGIEARKGFVVLTGEVGTGKTTLIHALLNELNGSAQTALIFSMIPSQRDLLRCVCEEFGILDPKQPGADLHDYLVSLNEFLLENYKRNHNCALIIDEAQNLSAEVLESIRLLSNFETPKDKLLQILLVGQPELAARLNSPELRQLKQRVTLRHHLRTLSQSETYQYITSRLRLAGGDPLIFTTKALETIHAYSGGIPRLINVLCDNAMLTGFAVGKRELDVGIIREVAEDLSLSSNSRGVDLPTHGGVNSANGLASSMRSTRHRMEMQAPPRPSQPQTAVVHNLATSLSPASKVPETFFGILVSELTEAMGPMAQIVVYERIRLLGESTQNFSPKKLGTLIDSVSEEIIDSLMKNHFQYVMYERVRTMKLS